MSNEAGGQGQLVRFFGVRAATLLVVSSIIGSGVYKKVIPMMDTLHSPGLVLLAWVLAGLATLLGVLTIAEVASLITDSGGPFAYLQRMYGKTFGYLYGWSSFSVIQSASIASIAYVFAQSVNAVIPLPHLGPAWEGMDFLGMNPLSNIGVKIVAIAGIVTLVAINYRGVKHGGFLTNLITTMVIGSIAVIVLLGLAFSNGSMANATTAASDFANYHPDGGWLSAMFTAMLAAFWAYEGWTNLGFIGEEVKEPHKTIPKALTLGILIIIGMYLAINFIYMYIIPADQLLELAKDENTIAAIEVMRAFTGSTGAFVMSLIIVITTLGCTNTTILTAARIYYAMARDKMFFRAAGKIHPVYQTPGNSLLMQCVWSCLLVLSGTFDQLTDMLIFASFLFYGSMAFGVFVLRRTMADHPRNYKVVGYPVVPALYILLCAGLIINTLMTQPANAMKGLALILLGLPLYYYWQKGKNAPSDN